jgi:predicted nucleic acid-binding protein
MIYIFDTNAVSDVIKKNPTMVARLREYQDEHVLCLCLPVHYEIRRGLLAISATAQLRVYDTQVRSQFAWTRLKDADWEQAARFWAETRRKGKQLSDADLLLAALATRLGATIVSADEDFDALPVKRENWRN